MFSEIVLTLLAVPVLLKSLSKALTSQLISDLLDADFQCDSMYVVLDNVPSAGSLAIKQTTVVQLILPALTVALLHILLLPARVSPFLVSTVGDVIDPLHLVVHILLTSNLSSASAFLEDFHIQLQLHSLDLKVHYPRFHMQVKPALPLLQPFQ